MQSVYTDVSRWTLHGPRCDCPVVELEHVCGSLFDKYATHPHAQQKTGRRLHPPPVFSLAYCGACLAFALVAVLVVTLLELLVLVQGLDPDGRFDVALLEGHAD